MGTPAAMGTLAATEIARRPGPKSSGPYSVSLAAMASLAAMVIARRPDPKSA